jgi:hypothetical protein
VRGLLLPADLLRVTTTDFIYRLAQTTQINNKQTIIRKLKFGLQKIGDQASTIGQIGLIA